MNHTEFQKAIWSVVEGNKSLDDFRILLVSYKESEGKPEDAFFLINQLRTNAVPEEWDTVLLEVLDMVAGIHPIISPVWE